MIATNKSSSRLVNGSIEASNMVEQDFGWRSDVLPHILARITGTQYQNNSNLEIDWILFLYQAQICNSTTRIPMCAAVKIVMILHWRQYSVLPPLSSSSHNCSYCRVCTI